MRRIGKYRRKKQKKILIIGSLSLLLFLCVGYAAFQTNLSITAKGNIKEKTRVIQSWEENSQTDFHSDFYKQNIVSATFVNNNKVPSNAAESWNVSEDKENGGVMAWVVPNNNDNYDLYIGAQSGVIANEDSSHLFYYFTNLNTINFNNNFDTRYVTNMHNIFCDDWNITNINFGQNFNTSNVTDMSGMFGRCYKLESIDLNNFDTRNVTDMNAMFYQCYNLKKLDLNNFDTSKVTDMGHIFRECRSITSLDLSNWDTGNVVNMTSMFSMWNDDSQSVIGTSLKEIKFGNNFNTSKVADMSGMFIGCNQLIEIDLSTFDTSNVTNMHAMFSRCSGLISLNLCSFNTSKVTDMDVMFDFTYNLTSVYVGANWITQNATTYDMFLNSGVSSVTTGQC